MTVKAYFAALKAKEYEWMNRVDEIQTKIKTISDSEACADCLLPIEHLKKLEDDTAVALRKMDAANPDYAAVVYNKSMLQLVRTGRIEDDGFAVNVQLSDVLTEQMLRDSQHYALFNTISVAYAQQGTSRIVMNAINELHRHLKAVIDMQLKNNEEDDGELFLLYTRTCLLYMHCLQVQGKSKQQELAGDLNAASILVLPRLFSTADPKNGPAICGILLQLIKFHCASHDLLVNGAGNEIATIDRTFTDLLLPAARGELHLPRVLGTSLSLRCLLERFGLLTPSSFQHRMRMALFQARYVQAEALRRNGETSLALQQLVTAVSILATDINEVSWNLISLQPGAAAVNAVSMKCNDWNDVLSSNQMACSLLQQGKSAVAAMIFSNSLWTSINFTHNLMENNTQKVVFGQSPTSVTALRALSVRTAKLAYNTGIAMLQSNKPFAAFLYFTHALGSNAVCEQPYVWLRLAECCIDHTCRLQDAFFETNKIKNTASPLGTEIVGSGRSRRLLVRIKSEVDMTMLQQLVVEGEQHITSGAISISERIAPKYLESCIELLTEKYSSSAVRKLILQKCSLTYAISCLRHSLHLIDENNTMQHRKFRLHVICKLCYVHSMLADYHAVLHLVNDKSLVEGGSDSIRCRYLLHQYKCNALLALQKTNDIAAAAKAESSLFGTAASNNEPPICKEMVPTRFLRSDASSLRLTDAQLSAVVHEVNSCIMLLMTNGDIFAAKQRLEQCIRALPQYLPAIESLLFIYLKIGKQTDVIKLLEAIGR